MPDEKLRDPQARIPAILVAAANAAHRKLYAMHLRRHCRVKVVEATTARQAIVAATRRVFACALIDASLPDADGVQLAALRRLRRTADTTPLIFILSNDAGPKHVQRCYRIGAVDVVTQHPADPKILVQKAKVYVQLFRQQKELRTEVSHVKGENRDLLQENREFLRVHENLRHQATHDPLTGLPNRILFADRLDVAAKRARRSQLPLAVVFIDLDRFKAVNDRHGHAAGDEVLRLVARRLTSALRGADTVARLGGDEFGILLETLETQRAATALAEKIHRVVAKPVRAISGVSGKRVVVKPGASIGVALLPAHKIRLQALINCADRMMYAAKRNGGGVQVFDSDRRQRSGTKVKPLRERRQRPSGKAAKSAGPAAPAELPSPRKATRNK